jgi:hypothetical protein
MDPIDIWRAARLLELSAAGDMGGCAMWARVAAPLGTGGPASALVLRVQPIGLGSILPTGRWGPPWIGSCRTGAAAYGLLIPSDG